MTTQLSLVILYEFPDPRPGWEATDTSIEKVLRVLNYKGWCIAAKDETVLGEVYTHLRLHIQTERSAEKVCPVVDRYCREYLQFTQRDLLGRERK